MTAAPDQLDALAERVEKLSGPDANLDADIHLEVYSQIALPDCPRYTSSLDAAMTLVTGDPIYSDWTVSRHDDLYRASIHTPHSQEYFVYGSTPSIALTAACLRARAQLARGK